MLFNKFKLTTFPDKADCSSLAIGRRRFELCDQIPDEGKRVETTIRELNLLEIPLAQVVTSGPTGCQKSCGVYAEGLCPFSRKSPHPNAIRILGGDMEPVDHETLIRSGFKKC